MSEELSRVKSRRRIKESAETSPPKDQAPHWSDSGGSEGGRTSVAPAGLSRSARHSGSAGKRSGAGSAEEPSGESTPSRSKTHRSERVRLSKLFVNSLIFIFVALLASLFWWGLEGAPDLDTLW